MDVFETQARFNNESDGDSAIDSDGNSSNNSDVAFVRKPTISKKSRLSTHLNNDTKTPPRKHKRPTPADDSSSEDDGDTSPKTRSRSKSARHSLTETPDRCRGTPVDIRRIKLERRRFQLQTRSRQNILKNQQLVLKFRELQKQRYRGNTPCKNCQCKCRKLNNAVNIEGNTKHSVTADTNRYITTSYSTCIVNKGGELDNTKPPKRNNFDTPTKKGKTDKTFVIWNKTPNTDLTRGNASFALQDAQRVNTESPDVLRTIIKRGYKCTFC